MVEYKNVNIIKASFRLMQKVGMGPVRPGVIEECEKFIADNNIDFLPWAQSCLDDLKTVLAETKIDGETLNDDVRQELIAPIMQIKASGAMFQNKPLTELAACLLHFLENIKTLDADVMQIIKANEVVLTAFLKDEEHTNVLTPTKEKLIIELRAACNRYGTKNEIGSFF